MAFSTADFRLIYKRERQKILNEMFFRIVLGVNDRNVRFDVLRVVTVFWDVRQSYSTSCLLGFLFVTEDGSSILL
jgi:hypothetical protein